VPMIYISLELNSEKYRFCYAVNSKLSELLTVTPCRRIGGVDRTPRILDLDIRLK
jgi:hypothetical protein